MLIAKAKELGAKTERNRFCLFSWIHREAVSADNTAVISDRGAEKGVEELKGDIFNIDETGLIIIIIIILFNLI